MRFSCSSWRERTSPWARADSIDGTIEGFVRGANGEVIAGAEVTATNVGTTLERKVASDASGRYAIPALPPGFYVVQASKQGFGTVNRANLEVRAGQVLTIEIDLSSTSFAETTEVTAVTPTVEVGRTVISNTSTSALVRALPLHGRSILDFFVVQPGVNAAAIPSGGSGSGTPTIPPCTAASGLRQMNVDGVSNNLQGGAQKPRHQRGIDVRSSRPSPTSRPSSAGSPAACRTRSHDRAATRCTGLPISSPGRSC